MNGDYSDNEKVWLVKSSGSILGPYVLHEVIQALKEHKISAIDEIRNPKNRWGFIREHSRLKEIVQRLRVEDSRQSEKTNVVLEQTKSVTESTLSMHDEKTPHPLNGLHAIDINGQERTLTSDEVSGFGNAQDVRVQKKIKSSFSIWRLLIWVVALGALGVAGVDAYKSYRDKTVTKSREEYMHLARNRTSLGLYAQALQFYSKADDLSSLSLEEKKETLPLLIASGSQTVQARRILDELASTAVKSEEKMELNYWRGLSWVKEGQYAAAETEFKKLLQENTHFKKVQLNLAINSLLRGDYNTAFVGVNHFQNSNPNFHLSLLVKALSVLHGPENYTRDTLQDLAIRIESITKVKSEFLPESLLILAAVQNQIGKKSEAEKTGLRLIDQIPDQSKFFIEDLEIDHQFLAWDRMGFVCEQLGSLSGQFIWKAIHGLCQYARGDVAGGLQTIDELRKQFPGERALVGLHAYLLQQSGRASETKALVQIAGDSNLKLPEYLKAQQCLEDKDFGCVESSARKVLSSEPSHIWFLFLQAQVLREKSQKDLANAALEKGLGKAPGFRPLIELRAELNGK